MDFTIKLPNNFRHIHLEQCSSTMEVAAANTEELSGKILLITTDEQTAGRGQRGNHWESAIGKNLLFSLVCEPEGVRADTQFHLSEATALSALCAIRDYLPPTLRDAVRIKWPNDIYVNDSKVCGMLLEHTVLRGMIVRTNIGIGINVNQIRFISDAPNPVSLCQVLGHELSCSEVLESFLTHFISFRRMLASPETLHDIYLTNLYRRTGMHKYRDEHGEFCAQIADIHPDGRLCLMLQNGERRTYAFKEVAFVL